MVMREPQRVPGAEWWPAGRQFIQRGTQRVQVCPLVHRPAGTASLLGRQIGDGSDDFGGVSELWPDLGS